MTLKRSNGGINESHLFIASALFKFNLHTLEQQFICDLEADNPITRSNDGFLQETSAPTVHTTCPAFGDHNFERLFVTSAKAELSNDELIRQPAGQTFTLMWAVGVQRNLERLFTKFRNK
ncbi:MAG: hypothetical protein V7784_24145 [Oceanospirillaceae bacterium]